MEDITGMEKQINDPETVTVMRGEESEIMTSSQSKVQDAAAGSEEVEKTAATEKEETEQIAATEIGEDGTTAHTESDEQDVVLSRREKRKERRIRNAKKRHLVKKIVLTFIAAAFAISFLLPTILTMANSFMSSAEISSNYGVIFNKYKQLDYGEKDTDYVAEKVNLKLIPDMVDFSQYSTVLLKSPQYLLKFWNSVILVIPIMIFQILVALGAAYSFMRFRSKRREVLFFMYVAVMLMPFQVTLVPNYIVADWLHILDTRWSIILPGIFAPFSVYLLTKFMRRIPDSLIEAAQLDGADEWQIFTKVCIPLCKGPIASVAILVFIDYWNMVEQPLIMLSDGDMHPLSVFLSKINTGEVGLAFAVATIYMVPTILIFLYGEEYLVDGISYSGSVKG